MKRPAFQFYPGDWRADVALRSCSIAARGLWIDLLCIAHDCEPYGHLALNGTPMSCAQIAGQVGLPVAQVRRLLDELVSNGVARRAEDGTVYSKRMVEDERVRNARAKGGEAGSEHGVKGAEHGSKGGRPANGRGVSKPPSEPPLPPPIEPPPSSSSSSPMLASLAPRAPEGGPEPARELEPAVALAVEARRHGIACNGADPRLRKLADEGVTPETLRAACEEAKRRKGAGVGIGYVVAVVTGWAEDAARIAVPQGAGPAEWKGAL